MVQADAERQWHPLADGSAPPWASEWGADDFGPFATLIVNGVSQRFRWMRAGRLTILETPYQPHAILDVTAGETFWMADTPVTQAMWEALGMDNRSEFRPAAGSASGESAAHMLQRPVENVSWDDAQTFCGLLARELGEEPAKGDDVRHTAAGFRLPSEKEWEWACRAGTATDTYAGNFVDGRESTIVANVAWFGENSDRSTHPVGEKEPNPWGLFDMLGNVWEWCEDLYDSGGADRALRGGSWFYPARLARAADRRGYRPDERGVFIGFRLARGRAGAGGAERRS